VVQNHQVTLVETGAVTPYAGNARTHSKKQVGEIAKSIKTFGFINPVVIDAQGGLVAGHGRWLAAKSMGLPQVPAIRADHLTPTQLRAYALADNKIAENAGWDTSLLRIELGDLMKLDLDFSIDTTGFSIPEIDLIVHGADALDVPPKSPPIPAHTVTLPGDIWKLGRHYVICGDARETDAIERVLNGSRIAMVLTDPPYNVKIDGHVSGLGETQHREFAMASGEMSPAQFTTFLTESVQRMAGVCADGALLYLFMDWRHLPELQAATNAANLHPLNLCVWVKSNGGMGSLYRSQHELVWVVKNGNAPHTNNVELGKHGRYRTNVWQYAGMNSFGAERDDALRLHPTVKPVAMIRDAMLDASHPQDWVLDSFLGSGTTLLAAEQCGRRCLGIELDPAYVDVALERWYGLSGTEPVHADLNVGWNAMRDLRKAENKGL
jgi:DNA modification methylase